MTAVKKPKIVFPKKGKTTTVEAIKHPLDKIHVYEITEQDLITLKDSSFNKSIYNIGIGVSFTLFISFLITTSTLQITDSHLYATFVALSILGFGFFILFLIFSIRCIYHSKGLFKRIKKEETP